MKTLLFLILPFTVLSCQKDERFYWKCIQTTISQRTGQKCPDITYEEKSPDRPMTRDEILSFKLFLTATGYSVQNGDTIRYKSDCQCWKLTCIKDTI
jgi:hypothetical protein